MVTKKNGADTSLNSFLEVIDNEYATIVENGIPTGDISGWVDTGSYSLNALASGSIYGGIPNLGVTVLAGQYAVGKTYFCVDIIKNFLEKHTNGACFYFETEGAITKDIFKSRGIKLNQVAVIPVTTVQEFRTQMVKLLGKYMEEKEKNRRPIIMVLDSLGNLSTTKEIEDIASGSDKQDMTRARLIKGTFRVINLALAKAKVPLIVTNHTYEKIGLFAGRTMGGGSGTFFAGSTIIFLSRGKEKDSNKDVIGNIVFCELVKGRFTKQFKKVTTLLSFEDGIHPYAGLIDIMLEYGIAKKSARGYIFPGDQIVSKKELIMQPENHFTGEVMEAVEKAVNEEFRYGSMKKLIGTGDEENAN